MTPPEFDLQQKGRGTEDRAVRRNTLLIFEVLYE